MHRHLIVKGRDLVGEAVPDLRAEAIDPLAEARDQRLDAVGPGIRHEHAELVAADPADRVCLALDQRDVARTHGHTPALGHRLARVHE